MESSIRKQPWRRSAVTLALALGLLLPTVLSASASSEPSALMQAENTSSCFTAADFQQSEERPLTGIFVTGVPEDVSFCLGSRVIAAGDALPAAVLEQLTYESYRPEGGEAQLTFLPISFGTVEPEAALTISLKPTEDKAPESKDGLLETYKNLENTGKFNVVDEEGSSLTYTITRQPRRGSVTIQEDGTFLFTPKKNKVGKDYFTFTATDAAGNVSNEATITIQILKATDDKRYTDITQESGQFEALWMKNTGLFAGTQVADNCCFQPEASVTRGEFLAMVMKLLDLPVEDSLSASGFADEEEAPLWQKPYLVSAMRMGLVSDKDAACENAPVFRPNEPITGAEAAVMLQNILMLGVSNTNSASDEIPVWAQEASCALTEAGVELNASQEVLTRMDAAKALYQVSKLTEIAPGLEVFQEQ